jgi:ribosome assembly protein YihI (activator of Der GTPase)
MAYEFTLKSANAMGDEHPDYGQAYWCYAEGSETPLKFNIKGATVYKGSKITAEEKVMKMGAKGEFAQLKKVKVLDAQLPSSGSQTTVTAQNTSSQTQLDRIESKLDQLLGMDKPNPEMEQAQREAEIDYENINNYEGGY